jgi:alpha-tubulin suppressor-like RCC1 family protein
VVILAAFIVVLATAVAAPAEAHVPYAAKAWGNNTAGQLGDGTHTGPEICSKVPERSCSTTPVEVGKLSGVAAVAGGQNHTLALLDNGTVMAWGANGSGQLGNATTTNSDVPVAVKGLSEVSAIAAGYEYSLAMLKNGKVMAWGENTAGQLGTGTKEGSDVPVEVKGLSEVSAIAAGAASSVALLKNGTVMAWGENLGNGTSEASDVPVAVCAVGEKAPCAKGLGGVTAIAASDFAKSSFALSSGGTVVGWGDNNVGQLGNGTTTSSTVPVAVSKVSEATAVAAGSAHALARLKNGTVMAWGENSRGQLGNGTNTGPETCGAIPTTACAKTPVAVPGLSAVGAIAAGGLHSVALLASGTVENWGENEQGELGDGTSTGPEPCGSAGCSTKPLAVGKVSAVRGIAAGREHTLAFGLPVPSVTEVTPKEGPKAGGSSVSITGAAFEEVMSVKFGGTPASSVKVNSEGSITAVAPPGSGTVDVTVTTPAGTSAVGPSDHFSYVHVPGVEPELGRCLRVEAVTKGNGKPQYHGGFQDPGCTRPSTAKRGHFEWTPGPGAKKRFTSIFSAPTLTAAGFRLSCAAGRAEGEYTGLTSLTVNKLVLTGCTDSPSKAVSSDCQNREAANGEIVTTELAGELGFIAHRKPRVGVDLKPGSGPTLASFECGGASEITGKGSGNGTAAELDGSVIGEITPLNAMGSSDAVSYAVTAGHQLPERFEGGFADTLVTVIASTPKPTTLLSSEEVKNEEALEINTRF